MRTELTAAEWTQYERDGYLRLGKTLTDAELTALQQRIDDIMLGRAPVDYERMLMQLDRIPGQTEAPGPQTKGHKGATLRYRKIQDLEFDPLFLTYMQKPLFRHICAQVYGAQTPIACFRAMFMNKPAREGTVLGPETVGFLEQFNANLAFVGSSGITVDGLNETLTGMAIVKRAILARARRRVALLDHSKFNQPSLAVAGALSDLNTLVTDQAPDGELASALNRAGVRVILPGS